jgi:hypothetical protein
MRFAMQVLTPMAYIITDIIQYIYIYLYREYDFDYMFDYANYVFKYANCPT